MNVRTILFTIAAIVFLHSCHPNKVGVKGHIKNGEGRTLFFETVNPYDIRTNDSLMLERNGKFSFVDEPKTHTFYRLRVKNGASLNLLLAPGEKAKLLAEAGDLIQSSEIKGSQGSQLVNQVDKTLLAARMGLDSLKLLYADTDDETRKNEIASEYQALIESHRKFTMGFILEHSSSLASLMALYQQIEDDVFILNRTRDLQFFKIVSDSLTRRYPKVPQVAALKENTRSLLSSYQSQRLLQMAAPGSFGLPDIALPGIAGDTITLSSLRGKYVLLSFWAAWNKNSLPYNLELKNIYDTYRHKGFEVYSVSLDNSYERWSRAVRFDELKWVNVNDSAFPNSMAAAAYNVQEIPTNYLIDKEQENILGKNLNPEALGSKLSGLLN